MPPPLASGAADLTEHLQGRDKVDALERNLCEGLRGYDV